MGEAPYGLPVRQLVHTLERCYHQSVLDDTLSVRRNLHKCLQRVHQNMQERCEKSSCRWISHTCDEDDYYLKICPLLFKSAEPSDRAGVAALSGLPRPSSALSDTPGALSRQHGLSEADAEQMRPAPHPPLTNPAATAPARMGFLGTLDADYRDTGFVDDWFLVYPLHARGRDDALDANIGKAAPHAAQVASSIVQSSGADAQPLEKTPQASGKISVDSGPGPETASAGGRVGQEDERSV
ncbi:uncharacterized protein PHACADRAFT_253155, partial [Phanerochaete carnosa HHB-10118-sp]